eukprot:gnl/Trimastix_PCT/86.p2 GENE.gnl/Trimastix_PCT/86~~gnl/Trimastix_PCT/86.p2  ORF type:complete len:411 (+),score=157.79 gnl/Trimastix_PCT/86:44-1276(+)
MLKACLLFLFVFGAFARTNWAVVVAGSRGWGNYRHQADVSHMHTLLLKHGFDSKHIIDMQYDDVADDSWNPRPGTLINKPGGPNVYPGHANIDYKGDDVTPKNFLSVISGNYTGVGPVVESTSEDDIFIYFSDHGGPGIVAFPAGGRLHADDWVNTLKDMARNHKFRKMVIYVEACHAGSMFDGLLPEDINIYVTTAANPYESSYAFYCNEPQYYTCLGDEYSIRFLEDLDQCDYNSWTLQQQYEKVKGQVKKSHVMQYGDKNAIPQEVVANFVAFNKFDDADSQDHEAQHRVAQHDAPLMMAWRRYVAADNDADREFALGHFQAEMTHRQESDARISKIAKHLELADGHHEFRARADDVDAFKRVIEIYEAKCGQFSDYNMQKHMITLVNALNSGVSVEQIEKAIAHAC